MTSIAQGGLGRRLFLPEAGEYEEIASSLNNMSFALQSEVKSLHAEKARFETALLGISDGVLLLNQDGKVDLANRAFHEMFDTGGDISGKPFLEVVRNHQLADIVREAHERHHPASAEIDIALPRQLHVYATALPILQESMREDRYRGVVIALHDITQLKKLEQMRKDFVANVSHELKTPIPAIQGFAETLLEGALEDREHGRNFVATIKANSERINSLVDDLRTISKIELGVIAVEKTDVAFGDVAEAVVALLRSRAEKKGLALTASVPSDAGMLQADRDRLIQIMTNLVENANKFTDQGSITIGMREAGGKKELFVEDTGIGVPEKHPMCLGVRFYGLDPARSRKLGGTGLGLAIVKHLVRAHGWETTYWNRDWNWTITKVWDGAYNLYPGDTVTHNDKVTVDPTYTDNFWGVKGEITVYNAHPTEAMTLTSLTGLAGGIDGNVTCESMVVPPLEEDDGELIPGHLTCTYDPGAQNKPNANPFGATNTATAVFAGVNWTGTYPIVFSATPSTEDEPVITVDDDNLTGEVER